MEAKVLSKQGTVQAGELQLDVICSYFGDRVFLVVTHLNKIGTLVNGRRKNIRTFTNEFYFILKLEVSRDSILGTSSTTYSVKTLLGKDEVSCDSPNAVVFIQTPHNVARSPRFWSCYSISTLHPPQHTSTASTGTQKPHTSNPHCLVAATQTIHNLERMIF